MSEIFFDEQLHEYRNAKGDRVYSVTQYLQMGGVIDTRWFTEEGRDRGSATHDAIYYMLEDDLDRDSVCEQVRPYVESAERFFAEIKLVPVAIERPVFDPIYGYAGKPDLIAYVNGSLSVIDYKTGEVAAWAALQTAAYAACVPGAFKRYAVRLKNDGTYRLIPFEDRNDIRVFRALVATVNWRIQNRLLVPETALAA